MTTSVAALELSRRKVRASYSILHLPPLPTKVKLADKVASLLLKGADVRRRDFICVLGGAAVAPAMLWPFAARAQQPGMPVVGFLGTRASGDDPQLLTALRRGLKEVGYVEGQNVAVEYRFAENQYDRLPTLAADLVRLRWP